MALPAVSPRSVAGAQPAFALTRARSSWTLWAGRRGRRARSVQGAVGVPPGGRCRPQSSLGTPASGPALGSGRDVHARRYGGCAEGDLASNLQNGQLAATVPAAGEATVSQCPVPGRPDCRLPMGSGCRTAGAEVQGKGDLKEWDFLFPFFIQLYFVAKWFSWLGFKSLGSTIFPDVRAVSPTGGLG